ncbi:unnamed protein product [Brassica rapa]|uniref:Splicing factor YJU2 n=2 Tax=Brassica TaxID=3705 RepID=A0A8D9HZZ8_BRACM|nr:unnamed protein product [Brassica napus]CAG7906709.1 unnamed protein product [Brassica rapa]
MAERKVLNKNYPADFDPKMIPRLLKPKNHQKKNRFMLPVPARCNKCGNYMSEGTKFNRRVEQVTEETYLGIEIYRFYFNCSTLRIISVIDCDMEKEEENDVKMITCKKKLMFWNCRGLWGRREMK